MNLLIDSKLCVTPHRITLDLFPDQAGQVRELIIVCEGDDATAIRQREVSTRMARAISRS